MGDLKAGASDEKGKVVKVENDTGKSERSEEKGGGDAEANEEEENPDFVLIWDESSEQATTDIALQKRRIFEENLKEEGLLLSHSRSGATQLRVLKLWAPLEVLKRYGEILRLQLPMKRETRDEVEKSCKQEQARSCVDSVWEKVMSRWVLLDPLLFPEKCHSLTGTFSRDREYLFDIQESNLATTIPLAMRARILQFILKNKAYKEGEHLDRDHFAFGYERLEEQGVYTAAFPLHDGRLGNVNTTRHRLYTHWASYSNLLRYQPLDVVKDYLGVHIAIYFAWLGYYIKMLVFASLFGILTFLYGLSSIDDDEYVQDICDKNRTFIMCPMCASDKCNYWTISEKCQISKVAHLFDNDFTLVFALLMSVWMACFLDFWKRYASRITYRWDLSNFDLKDVNPRPEYVAELKKIYRKRDKAASVGEGNKVEGGLAEERVAKHRSYDFDLEMPFWKKRLPFKLLSLSTVLLLVTMAVAALVGVIMYRLWFTNAQITGNDKRWTSKELVVTTSAAFLNLAFIILFGKVYERIAEKLTDLECPRTQPQWDSSYTLKIYLLEFINNYGSIFYVAFFKGAWVGAPNNYHTLLGLRQEECGVSCMPELCIQMVVIMIGKQARSMIFQVTSPGLKRIVRRTKQRLKVAAVEGILYEKQKHRLSRDESRSSTREMQWTHDYDLLEWSNYALVNEYLQMVVQFGFVTIFVTAFPLAPLFALLNNIFEVRVDANKMLKHFRRPVGIRVKDIGIWSSVIEGVVKVAILANACVIALTSSFIPKLMYRYVLQNATHPDYGTLKGYLESSLTKFYVDDLEFKPSEQVLLRTDFREVKACYYPTLRQEEDREGTPYSFRMEHWQIWLARLVFVIVYQNLVGVIMFLLHWLIPDMPSGLRRKMQREQKLVNELIMRQELQRSDNRSTMSAPTSARERSSAKLE